MKFQVVLKDPDTLYDAISDAVAFESDAAEVAHKAREVASKWFRNFEYLTVEIDTDAETISVIPTR